VGAAGPLVSQQTTLVEMDDPPGYFRIARTGRVHLVKTVTRVSRSDGATHLMVMPTDPLECVGCQQARYRGLPCVRPQT
jgi:hypothetical protein